jgi:hypothetical protein
MSAPVLDWKGAEVRRRVAAACAVGVDATMEDAAGKARAAHPAYPPASEPGERYATRTGDLTASIGVKDPAVEIAAHVVGVWGASADDALYVEIGTSRKGSGAPRAQTRALTGASAGMWAIPGPSDPPQMSARYYLRPAASEAYSLLGLRIAAAYQGTELG